MITGYDEASDEPHLVRAPRTTFVSVSGAGAPATPAWHRKKRLVTDIARQLATAGFAADGQPAEHLQYHYLPSMPPTNIADFYSVNPLTELHYRVLARVTGHLTPEDIAQARRAAASPFDDDDEIEIHTFPEQLVIQVMHRGPFANELATLAHLDPFILEAPQDTLRTILRDPVNRTHPPTPGRPGS